MSKSKEEILKLPTILDILDQLAKVENADIPPLDNIFPSHQYYEDGFYIPIRHGDIINHKVILMPASQAGMRLYRGQNQEFIPSYPSIYRKDYLDSAKTAIARLKAMEFKLIIQRHPVINEMEQRGILINYDAICQHYGFPTEMLDLTNNKWVAAFMATTLWNKSTGEYTPIGKDFKDGYGVIYVSDDIQNLYDQNKLFPIGFQFFQRPSLQFCFGLKMADGEDFSKLEGFTPLYFRHDIDAAKCVFAMSYNQNRFSPDDYIANLANAVNDSKTVSKIAIEATMLEYYKDKESDFLTTICLDNNIEIINIQAIHYDKAKLNDEVNFWQNEGFKRLRSHILPAWPITKISLSE